MSGTDFEITRAALAYVIKTALVDPVIPFVDGEGSAKLRTAFSLASMPAAASVKPTTKNGRFDLSLTFAASVIATDMSEEIARAECMRIIDAVFAAVMRDWTLGGFVAQCLPKLTESSTELLSDKSHRVKNELHFDCIVRGFHG